MNENSQGLSSFVMLPAQIGGWLPKFRDIISVANSNRYGVTYRKMEGLNYTAVEARNIANK